MELCSETGNKAAAYHLARYFEKKGDFKRAIDFFQQASAINNAMRLCRVEKRKISSIFHFLLFLFSFKENRLDEYLAGIAMKGTPDDMLEAARYFQSQPMQEDRAILLYHKVRRKFHRTVSLLNKKESFSGRIHFESDRFSF